MKLTYEYYILRWITLTNLWNNTWWKHSFFWISRKTSQQTTLLATSSYFKITPFLPVIIGSSWGRRALSSPLRPIIPVVVVVSYIFLILWKLRDFACLAEVRTVSIQAVEKYHLDGQPCSGNSSHDDSPMNRHTSNAPRTCCFSLSKRSFQKTEHWFRARSSCVYFNSLLC